MKSPECSLLSSLRGVLKSEEFIQPHYKESYRLAIDCLASGGRDSYQEFLKGERIGSFLSEEELIFITEKAVALPPNDHEEEISSPPDIESSSGTYWPVHSDVEAPDLELGWPDVMQPILETNIDLLFHPPRQNNPTIKEVIRKHIQDARQVVAIAMDMFTDVDLFKEAVDASIRGVPVYVLLDGFHLKSFLAMAENQDVKIHQLRNMRVRTVKGSDYLCRSGAKFHGAMEQKFLLVDCLTAIYGSYSFTWSFEKINLSMVQVITGHLVKSYDEEFRTLYARSAVPAELCPQEAFPRNGPHEQLILPNTQSAEKIEWRDELRQRLDTVYRKTCEKKPGARDLEGRLFEEEPNKFRPFIENGSAVQNQMHFIKRHSYAGGRPDGPVPQNIRPGASNLNIAGNGTNHYPMDNYSPVPQIHRGQNMHQSFNGNDTQIVSMQQNMPTLENTSRSFMRTLRIESYLKHPDVPFSDSCEFLDQSEPRDKANSFMQGRIRSSLAFRSTIPEQMEPNRHLNNSSTCVNSLAVTNTPLHYSSMQWKPHAAAEHGTSNDEYMVKRQSSQIRNDNRNHANSGAGRTSYHSVYTSLGRDTGGHMVTNQDIMSDSWHKRHSVADPRSNTEYKHESSDHMYGAFARTQVNRSTVEINRQSGGYGSTLKEDLRSASHCDVKTATGTKSHGTPIWQDPPTWTVSAAALDVDSRDIKAKANSTSSQLKKTSKTIKSMFNISDKKEDSAGAIETQSLKSTGSTDTITAEDEEKTSYRGGKYPQSTTNSVRSSSRQQRKQTEGDTRAPSEPHFRTKEQKNPRKVSLPKLTTQKKPSVSGRSVTPVPDSASWSNERGPEPRLYSKNEPFSSFEKKRSAHGFGNSQEKPKGLPEGEDAIEHNLSRAARGHYENKLEKFIHRMGSLIHKK
ncbi:protein FAM83B [Pseudoliparis swirei]|uniref:protein FAM83B n=1 Tax=Pseudoliparis swirei TaxID=2059687 RepID=UPI0024BEEE09|nr:protein FAM83B [Pseudoliparis swirei]